MRYITALLIALALPLSAQVSVEVDTTDAVQAAALQTILDAKAVALAEAADSTRAQVAATVVADSLNFAVLGTVTIIADTRDAQWVQIDLPLASSTGLAQILVGQAIVEAKQDYGAKDTGTVGRVRLRKDRALSFLRGLDAALNP